MSNPATTTYATVGEVADFIRVDISPTSLPNDEQVADLIVRNEDKFEQRTGHAWRERTETNEYHDIPLLYSFGWGSPIFMKRRAIKTGIDGLHLDSALGDKLEIWSGATNNFADFTDDTAAYNLIPERGKLTLRGFIFSILRKDRVRVTYRWGDTVVPGDVKKAIILMTCIDIIRTSFRMDDLPFGGMSIDKEKSMDNWEEEVNRIVRNREEFYFIP